MATGARGRCGGLPICAARAHMGPMSQASPQSRALVLFSGGQDSSVCLAWALARHDHVETVGFDYGQRHAVEMEQRSVVRQAISARFPQWAGKLGEDHVLDLTGFGAVGDTAMTQERAFEITEKGLPNTYVPGRNLVFLTYAAALAAIRAGLAVGQSTSDLQ